MSTQSVIFGDKKIEVIDLTLTMDMDSQTFPGDPCPNREVFSELEKTGYEHYVHNLGDHFFVPHADAPNHQCPDLKDKGVESWGFDLNSTAPY